MNAMTSYYYTQNVNNMAQNIQGGCSIPDSILILAFVIIIGLAYLFTWLMMR